MEIEWIAIMISIIALGISVIVDPIRLIQNRITIRNRFGAYISLEDRNGKTFVKNVGAGYAYSVFITAIDYNGTRYLASPIIDSLAKDEEKEVTFTQITEWIDMRTREIKETVIKKPERIVAVVAKYKDFQRRSKINRYGVMYTNNDNKNYHPIKKKYYDGIMYQRNSH